MLPEEENVGFSQVELTPRDWKLIQTGAQYPSIIDSKWMTV
jgi:hypothetical protein